MSQSQDETRSPVSTVAVGTDFSETAGKAVRYAADLAAGRGARLVIVHVSELHPFAVGGPQPAVLPADFEAAVREASQKRLAEVASECAQLGIEVETVLETGAPGVGVVQAAERNDADLIVVGTRGLSGLKHFILGSTAEEVARTARCPVLTVHPDDPGGARELRTVLLPTDFSDDADHAADELARLFGGDAAGARVVLLTVYHLPVLLEPLFGDIRVVPASFDEIAGPLTKDLEPIADRLRKAGFEVEPVVREGDPAAAVTELAESLRPDLIVMGTRGRSGLKHLLLGSTSERVLQRACCPVLTVRRES